MSTSSVQPPYEIFTDIDGQPLEDGYIWIGTAGLPAISNPITVYWNAALTIPAVQPIRTIGGYPMNSGTPAVLYVSASDYSILVQNKNGSSIYSSLNATERYSSALVTFLQAGANAVQRTAQAKMRDIVSVKDFGAVGDGVTNDTAAFISALSANNPVYVPQSTGTYIVSSLTAAQSKLLYGPGVVSCLSLSSERMLSTNPFIGNDFASIRVNNDELQPSQWPGTDGSLYNCSVGVQAKRTGGFGSYGNILSNYTVSDSTPSPEFDVGVTSWVTHQNLSGGQVFAGWLGANSPSSSLSQTWSIGAAIGLEINVGNRWSDFGYLPDVGAARYTVGLQIVPDILPAIDGPTASVYPGSFAQVIGASGGGHKWWTGVLFRSDSIMPNGVAFNVKGGSSIANACYGAVFSGNFLRCIDLTSASASLSGIALANLMGVQWTGGGQITGGTGGTIALSTFGAGEGGLYAGNFSSLLFRWSVVSAEPRLGFYGAAATGKPTVTGSRGGNAALASLLTGLSNLGLITDSTTA